MTLDAVVCVWCHHYFCIYIYDGKFRHFCRSLDLLQALAGQGQKALTDMPTWFVICCVEGLSRSDKTDIFHLAVSTSATVDVMSDTCARCEALTNAIRTILDPTPARSRSQPQEHQYADISQFIGEKCVQNPNDMTPIAILYSAYRQWCSDNMRQPTGVNKFATALSTAGHPPVRGTAGIRLRRGIKLSL